SSDNGGSRFARAKPRKPYRISASQKRRHYCTKLFHHCLRGDPRGLLKTIPPRATIRGHQRAWVLCRPNDSVVAYVWQRACSRLSVATAFSVSPAVAIAGTPEIAGALVMAADYRGLGVARSLGRRGIPVWVLKQGGHLIAATSRYVRRSIPWPAVDDRKGIDLLLGLAARHNLDGWVLFPTDDHAVALTSRYHEILS